LQFRVSVNPHFHEDADNLDVRAAFEERIKLESSAPKWVQAPENVLLPHNGRNFW
jgi:tripeptidyl-peptidase-2